MSLRRDTKPATTPTAGRPTRAPKPAGIINKVLRRFKRDHSDNLDEGLTMLYSRLGLHETTVPTDIRQENFAEFTVCPAAACPRSLFYAPNMDGHVDPGEVVWFWVAPDDQTGSLTERALVVVGRHGDLIIGLLTSPNPSHADSTNWLDIGAGPWDDAGRQSWVRLDKVIKVPETAIRRQGAVIPEHRFNRIANRLRSDHGWA